MLINVSERIKLVLFILSYHNLLIFCMDLKGLSLRKYYNPKPIGDVLINKVTLTQKGYIQFLRYITEVPAINEFTFCLWMKSNDLSNNHPLLSYSRNEKERKIRAWITPNGSNINIELNGNLVYSVPVKFQVNLWYHICQSWDNFDGTWQVYINGKLKAQGADAKLRGLIIPSKGDVVVGQEYTDFNKGLDDGIEGDIYGFNLVLASASKNVRKYNAQYTQAFRGYDNLQAEESRRESAASVLGYFPSNTRINSNVLKVKLPSNGKSLQNNSNFTLNTSDRMAKDLITFGEQLFKNMLNFFTPPPTTTVRWKPSTNHPLNSYRQTDQIFSPNTHVYNTRRTLNDHSQYNDLSATTKPLGQVLMELSFHNCALGKGSPINDQKVLISWTKTPVRVFGGALWKPAVPFCKIYK